MSDADRTRLADELKRAFHAARELGKTRRDVSGVLALSAKPPAADGCDASLGATGSMSFTLPLLRAVLAGQKTQTRRPVRPVPARVVDGVPRDHAGDAIAALCSAGDRLWVREKWARAGDGRFVYAIDGPTEPVRWIASRFMPRAATRYTLAVGGVRLTRLGATDVADAVREGIDAGLPDAREAFITLWDSIYGGTPFAAASDPWVWAIDFRLEGDTPCRRGVTE